MVLYLDTETTGLHPGNICQLSYILQSGRRVEGRNVFFSVDFVEYGALMVHGFSVQKLKDLSHGKRFGDWVDVIEQDFSKASLIVAHNSSFDFMFLRKEFEENGKIFCPQDSFCTMKNSVELCKLTRPHSGGYKYPKLSELCEFFDITDTQIAERSAEIFGGSGAFHDARFDTTALFLASNSGVRSGVFAKIEENL